MLGACKVFFLLGLTLTVIPLGFYFYKVREFRQGLVSGDASTEIDQNPAIDFKTESAFSVRKVNVEDLTFSVIIGEPSGTPIDTIMFVHGFPDCFHTFSHQMRAFVQKGYRVISPEIRGYEPTSLAADGDYRAGTLAHDLLGVIEGLHLGQIHAIGHDWGSSIVNMAAKMKPSQFKTIGMFAVPDNKVFMKIATSNVPYQLVRSHYIFFNQLPYLPEASTRGPNGDFAPMRAGLSKVYMKYNPERIEMAIDTLSQPGVLEGALGYYRSLFDLVDALKAPFGLGSLENAEYKAFQQLSVEVPTLAIAGKFDIAVDWQMFKYSMNETNFPAGYELHYLDCGHFVQHEKAEEVTDLIEKWLLKHSV